MMDFFISYNKADHAWAQWIAWRLEEAGYTTILQAWDFRPGSNFVLEMDRAARQTRCTIAVLSPDYIEAAYTHPEWADAFSRDPGGNGRVLVPVRVRDCEPSGLLAQVVYIDLVGLDEDRAKEVLLAQLKGGRAKPGVKPVFPLELLRPAPDQPYFPAGPVLSPPTAPSCESAAANADSLYRTLEGSSARTSRGPHFSTPTPAVAASAARFSQPPISLEPAVIRRAEQDLTLHVGPIAKILVREAATVATGTEDLYQALAIAIPVDGDRKAFLRRAVGATPS